MSKKLTLTLSEGTIKRAKRYSKKKRVSLSRLVENYFSSLASPSSLDRKNLPPVTAQLSGMFKGNKVANTRETLEKALQEKYL